MDDVGSLNAQRGGLSKPQDSGQETPSEGWVKEAFQTVEGDFETALEFEESQEINGKVQGDPLMDPGDPENWSRV